MLLDNVKIHATLSQQGENIIACKSIQEVFLDVFEITVNEHIQLLKPLHRKIKNDVVVVADVDIGGELYKNVEFKVKKSNSGGIFLNQSTLEKGGKLIEEQDAQEYDELCENIEAAENNIIEEQTFDSEELRNQIIEQKQLQIKQYFDEFNAIVDKKIDDELSQAKQSILAETLNVHNNINDQTAKNFKATFKEFKQNLGTWAKNVETKLVEYVEEAIADAELEISQKCNSILQENLEHDQEKIQSTIASIIIDRMAVVKEQLEYEMRQYFDGAITKNSNKTQNFVNEQIEQIQQNIYVSQNEAFDAKVAELIVKQQEWLQQHIKETTTSFDAKLIDVNEQVNSCIASAASDVADHIKQADSDIEQKLASALQTLNEKAQQLHEQRMQTIEQSVADVLKETTSEEQTDVISEARSSARNAVKDALASYKSDMSKDLNAQLMNIQKELHTKMQMYVQSYGGGGTVAMQFADGGTMNGTLNVANGQILSGGADLFDLFSTSVAAGYQTLAFNENNATLTITPNGNTISLSALSGGNVASGEPLFTTWAQANSANYDSAYSTVQSNSSNWSSVYSSFNTQSADNASVYSTVLANSATNWNYQGSDIKALSSNWQNTYTTVFNNSAAWATSTSSGEYLPLSGGTLTGDLEIQAAITAVDSIQFNLASEVASAPGLLTWNAEESTLNLGVNNDVTLQLGQETLIQVKNTSGEVIYNGTPVYASGAAGGGSGNITVSAYNAGANDVDELYFLGVATQELADSDFGFITTFGKVRGVVVSQVQATDDVGALSAWPIGTILYPSATQTGKFTSTPPKAPNKDLPVAMVISVNGNQRSFFVRAEAGYHLDELHDVARITPQNDNVLTFSTLSGVWYPKAPETNYLPLTGGTLTGTLSTNEDVEITDSTKGIILTSPSNYKYRVTVTDAGELVTTLI